MLLFSFVPTWSSLFWLTLENKIPRLLAAPRVVELNDSHWTWTIKKKSPGYCWLFLLPIPYRAAISFFPTFHHLCLELTQMFSFNHFIRSSWIDPSKMCVTSLGYFSHHFFTYASHKRVMTVKYVSKCQNANWTGQTRQFGGGDWDLNLMSAVTSFYLLMG